MLAHNFEKSNLGIFGFDTINIFTNDEIYCSGFSPAEEDIDRIGSTIRKLKRYFFTEQPIHLYINKKNSLFWIDVKVHSLDEALFSDSQGKTLSQALSLAEKKLIQNSPCVIDLEPHLSTQDHYQPSHLHNIQI
jgi:hypothetical protein